MNAKTIILALVMSLWLSTALAEDVTVTPPPGGGIDLKADENTTALKVYPDAHIQIPQLPNAPSYNDFVCRDAQGNLGRCNNSLSGIPGPIGPVGPIGPKGDKGDAGDVGPAGPKGDKGDAGDTGPAGPKGDKGDAGDTGPAGPKGDKGDAGDAGPAGPKGDKGDGGDTGPAGPKGDKGDAGDTGPQGPPGPQGPAGTDGSSTDGLSTVKHGCINGSGGALSGTGFSASQSGNTYTITYTSALTMPYSLLVDARSSTGRSLAMQANATASSSTITIGWIEANETISSICFFAAK